MSKADRLAALLASLQRDVHDLQRAPRLGYASLEGRLNLYNPETGDPTGTIGNLPDGTTGLEVWNGPKPPRPSTPIAVKTAGGLVVRWDGEFAPDPGSDESAILPMDFKRVEVHIGSTPDFYKGAADTMRSTIESPRGGDVVIVPLALETKYVLLVTRTTSGRASDPSDMLEGTPGSVVSDEEIAAINAALEQNDAALAQAKVDLAALDVALAQLDEDLVAARSDLSANSAALATLNTDLTSARAELATHDGRIATLNSDLAAANERIDGLGTSAGGDGRVYYESTPPSTGTAGDVWFHTGEGNRPYRWDGNNWVSATFGAQSLTAGSITSASGVIGALDAGAITTGTMDAARITAGTITTDRMTANSINGDRIAANTLNASKIVAGSITTDRMTANSIDGDRIAANTLHAGKIVAGSITTDRMTANSINGDRITGNTLNASKIVAGSITTDRMTANSINGDRITGGTIVADKLAANTITSTSAAISSLNADWVTAGTMRAERINGGDINGVTITGVTITGGTVQTATSGRRIQMSSAANDTLSWFDANGNEYGKVQGASLGYMSIQAVGTMNLHAFSPGGGTFLGATPTTLHPNPTTTLRGSSITFARVPTFNGYSFTYSLFGGTAQGTGQQSFTAANPVLGTYTWPVAFPAAPTVGVTGVTASDAAFRATSVSTTSVAWRGYSAASIQAGVVHLFGEG